MICWWLNDELKLLSTWSITSCRFYYSNMYKNQTTHKNIQKICTIVSIKTLNHKSSSEILQKKTSHHTFFGVFSREFMISLWTKGNIFMLRTLQKPYNLLRKTWCSSSGSMEKERKIIKQKSMQNVSTQHNHYCPHVNYTHSIWTYITGFLWTYILCIF